MTIRMIFDFAVDGQSRQRAERTADLAAVPRVGEIIDVAGVTFVLKVTGVRWSLTNPTPTLFLGRTDGTPPSVTEEGGELMLTEPYVDQIREAGWQLSDW
ncbi:MAG: hypothetical protein ACYDHN_01730 [Solirubrobacteraceae bacterium]